VGRFAFALSCVLAACSSPEQPLRDLGVAQDDLSASSSDLAPADLAWQLGPLDLGGWCVGTTLAGIDADGGATTEGECARQYFARFAACFRPAGQCTSYVHLTGTDSCWDDGALASYGRGYPSGYTMPGRSCMRFYTLDPAASVPVVRFCISSSTHECVYSDPPDLGGPEFAIYSHGVFTCPDGTSVHIDVGGCAELNALMLPWSNCNPPSMPTCTPFPMPPRRPAPRENR
jgi:hypothetical protein